RYWCRYKTLSPSSVSSLSNPVELVVLADPRYVPPTVSLRPGGRVEPGTNVTIRCQSPYGANFSLYKNGNSVPIRTQHVGRGDTATFIFNGVTEADTGTYGCSYRSRENPFISSHPRAEVTLEVAPGGSSLPPT
ncbi:IGSF1 protein, partial [Nothocercus julius]|nr:IGSF1 protein [Nothocercus julius]